MPDFGISIGIPRFGVQPLLDTPFGTPSLDTALDALVNGGAAFASAGNTPKKHCYEIFVAEIIKTELGAPGEEQETEAWGVNQKLGGSLLEIKHRIMKIGGYAATTILESLNITGHIQKLCYCLDMTGISGVTTQPALIKILARMYGFYPGNARKDFCNPGSTHYKCFTLTKVCGKIYQKEECGRSTPSLEVMKTNPKTAKVCPCNDMKIISLAGVTNKTKEYTTSEGTKIKLKNPGNFEEVMHQIVVAEKKIKLKCAKIIEYDHPAKEPPEER